MSANTSTMDATLKVRVATLEDAEAIKELVELAFRAEDSREDWTGDMSLASGFRMELADVKSKITGPNSAIIVFSEQASDTTIIGCVGVAKLTPQGDNGPSIGRLSIIAVDHNRHRGGLGRQILAQGEEYCRQTWGVDRLGLNALSTRKQLLAWYQRRGYEPSGELSPFPYEFYKETELPAGLCFVEMYKDAAVAGAAAGGE